MVLVVIVTFVLYDNPPQKTEAHSEIKDVQKAVEVLKPAPTVPAPPAVQVAVAQAPVPEPAPAPVVHPVGCANYQHIINRYDWNVNVIAQICQAESGGNPYAVGDTRVIGGIYAPSCGLFQIRTLAGRPSCEQLQDPETNIAWAHKIYKGQGYPAWSVCKTKVRCY